MDILYLIPIAWLLHVVVAWVLLALIIPFSRKRVHWQRWELLALILPYSIFAILMLSNIEPKNPLNMFDAGSISVAVAIAALVRVAVGARIGERLCAVILMCLLCVVAVIVYFTASVVRDSM
jgi:phosphatidylserine synthase